MREWKGRVALRRPTGWLLLLLAGIGGGCGKIGEPLPPIPRAPLTIGTVGVRQEGGELILRIGVTRPRLASRPVRVDLYRLVNTISPTAGEEKPILPEEYVLQATLLASIPVDQLPVGRSNLSYRDPLRPSPGARPVEYVYAARVIGQAGPSLDLSEYGRVVPYWDVALPPTALAATQEEKAVQLRWEPSGATLSGRSAESDSLPGLVGYHVYRRTLEEGVAWQKLNDAPVPQPGFTDREFRFTIDYVYQVRAVSGPVIRLGGEGAETVESAPSQELRHRPVDTFPPSAPSGVTVASVNGIVSLFWPLNPEVDVVGYHLYRAETEDAPASGWLRITTSPLSRSSFRDDRVAIGRTYFYRLTAVDQVGNESLPSPVASETVQP
ncbi:MAG: fibronectin type III domain-containing protein [Blastocatellia bacterium]